jgi:nucleoside-triphosphatase THEP1
VSVDSVVAVEGGSARRWWLGGAALLCIAVQLPGSLVLSAAALALWLLLLLLFDRPTLERLWLPRFWIVTLVFAVASGLLLGPKASKGVWSVVSRQGLEAGVLMVVRGAFIFGLAAWASRALGGKDLQRAARRLGVPRLGTALAVALQLLPELEERLHLSLREPVDPARGLRRLQRFRLLAVRAISQTARLAETLARGVAAPGAAARSTTIVAIVGAPHSGKTTLLTEVVSRLRQRGLRVGGITQPALYEDGQRQGYRLRDAATGEEHPLARRRSDRAPGELGYDFDGAAWTWAQRRLREARSARDLDVLVVDELGRLEARGEGHLPALAERLDDERVGIWLLGVRADCATAIAERLGTFSLTISPEEDAPQAEHLAERIASACSDRSAGL